MSSARAEKTDPPATRADLLALPNEGQGHELIDGQILPKETSTEHGRAQANVVTHLNWPFGRRPGGRWPGGWWFATEVLIDFGPTRLYRPDVVGWRRERVPAPPTGR